MKIVALVSMVTVLMIWGCQHTDRLVEPIPKSTPIPYNKYMHFALGDSLRYGGGILLTDSYIDSILEINGHQYYRFRNFPNGPYGAWPDLLLRPDSSGNIKMLNRLATDSGTTYSETTLLQFSGGVGSSWSSDYGLTPGYGTLESLSDTVTSNSATYLGCARIRYSISLCGQEELYWLAPGIGVVKADWDMWCSWSYIPPPEFLSWWNFHPRPPR